MTEWLYFFLGIGFLAIAIALGVDRAINGKANRYPHMTGCTRCGALVKGTKLCKKCDEWLLWNMGG